MTTWHEASWFSLLMGVALKSIVLLSLAWVAAALLRKQSAAIRHLVWTVAAASALALPLLSISLPALRFGTLPAFLPAPADASFVVRTTLRAGDVAGASVGGGAPLASSKSAPSAPTRRMDWMLCAMMIWTAGTAISFANMLAACFAVWRLRRTAQPLHSQDLEWCAALARQLGIHGRFQVLETAPGSMPMTSGVLRPAILLPADAAAWTAERRQVVLLHEMAHVRRADAATHILARVVLAVYWWNPLAWKLWRAFLKEEEGAADDLVLNSGAAASDYAEHLLGVARAMRCPSNVGWAAVAMARRSQLESRLANILDGSVRRTTPGRACAALVTVAALAILTPLAALHAQDSQPKAEVPADVDSAIRAATSQKNPQILEDAAKAAEQQRNFDTARQLLEPAVAIRAEISGQHSIEYGLGLLKLGELDGKRGKTESALDFYTRAAEILGNRPVASPALMYLGKNALKNKNYPEAEQYFEHAQNVDPSISSMALMWMGVTRDREKAPDQAETFFQRALAVATQPSNEAVTVNKVYAQFLRSQGRKDEASEVDQRSDDAQKVLLEEARAKITIAPPTIKIGPGMIAPHVLQSPQPQYSEDARMAKLQGKVYVALEVGTDGLARNIRVVQGIGLGLDDAAVEAIKQWRFQPGTKDGQVVRVAATVEVNFRLL